MFKLIRKIIGFVTFKIEMELTRLKDDWKEYSEEFDRMREEYSYRHM